MGIETLNEDLELNIPMFDDDMDIIAKLDDEPNAVGGLTAAELKAEFDRPGKTIQEYLNKTLIPSLIGTVAEESVRAQNEYIRVTNENQRIINEEVREVAETARSEAENSRKAAETAREQAEEGREKTIKLISDLTVSAETLPAGEKAQVEKTVENGAYSLKLKIPEGKSGRDGAPGPAGADGFTPKITANETTDGYNLLIQNKNDLEMITIKNGKDGNPGPVGKSGSDGAPGSDGVGIKSVVQTELSTEDQGRNTMRITKTDGTTTDFYVFNGRQGRTGPVGKSGKDGSDGNPGKSAYEYAKDGGFTGTEEEFAELLANGNGGGADWDQNDPEGAGYVKGRTHYREPKYKDTFPETSVAFDSKAALIDRGSGKALVDGETYFVTWNGETYQVEASVFAESGEVYVGDWDTVKYPFFIENSSPTRLYVSKATSTIETITLKIQQLDGWDYHPFQADYLPLGVPYAEHVDEVILPECSYDTDMDGSYVWGDYDFELIEGYVYDVVFNGTLYRCPATKPGNLVLLNGSAYTEDYDPVGKAPFSYFFPNLRKYGDKMMCAGMLSPTPDTGTISITGYTKVQKVDPMSMPDRTGIYEVDFAYETDPETGDDNIIPQPDNKTAYNRALNALNAGRTIVARLFYENGNMAGEYQMSRSEYGRDWYFTRVDTRDPASPAVEILHWDPRKEAQSVTLSSALIQPQITGQADQFVVIGEDGKPVAKELDLGGGLVVVKATDSGKANYSSTEIKELYESGHTVVFDTEDSTGSKVVYQLKGVRPVQALFEYHDGSTEKADYHKSVYVDSNKLITFANTIIPIVNQTSDLENDVPFVSASDSQTLTEDQQKKARENIGLGGLVVSEGGDTLTWDGNTEGLVIVDVDGNLLVKVTDTTPSIDDFTNGAYVYVTAGTDSGGLDISASDIAEFDGALVLAEFVGVIAYKEGADVDGIILPEPGVYFPYMDNGLLYTSFLTIPGYTGFTKKQVNPEYLPKNNLIIVTLSLATGKLSHTPAEIQALLDQQYVVLCSFTFMPFAIIRASSGEITATSSSFTHSGTALRITEYAFDADGMLTSDKTYSVSLTET